MDKAKAVRSESFRGALRPALTALLVILLLPFGQAFGAGETGPLIKTSATGGIVAVERYLDDTRALISVSDAAKKPIFGLTDKDFIVTDAGRTARIVSVKPIEESLDIPRHIVLVLDNSDSMRQRNAIEPLLAGVDELLKIVRPIDQMQVVVFSKDDQKMKMGGRDLRVKTFSSNQKAELKKFVAGVYRDGITSTTVLYEGMLAGLELIRTHPENEPRFLVVFSDGEDLNSAYKDTDVLNAVKGIGRFRAFGIDYMPVQFKDPFLTDFAEKNNGELWKAASETNLVPIFQSVASKMQYYYVVSYLFPTTGTLAVEPASISIDDVVNFDAAAMGTSSATTSVIRKIDASSLTLRPSIDTPYDIASWKVSLVNNDGALAVQAGEGTPGKQIVMPIKTDDLGKLAAGGDIKATMEVQDRKGQSIVLSAPPVKVNHYKTSGGLSVAQDSLIIDEVVHFNAAASPVTSVVRRIDTSALTLRPAVDAAHGVADWKLSLRNKDGVLAEQAGTGTPGKEIPVAFRTDDLEKLGAAGDISAVMEVKDRKGQNMVLKAMPVKIKHFRTSGSLSVAQDSLVIDEVVHFNAAVSPATSVVRRIDASALTLRPVVDAAHGVADWKLSLRNKDGVLAEQEGTGTPGKEISVPFRTDDLEKLGAAGDISAVMEVKDRKGQSLMLNALPVKIKHFRTSGSLSVAPASVTIEEIKTIDSSPMLGYVYFAEGSNEIPADYVRLSGSAETASFDAQRFRDTLEKHYQVLNIIGKRLNDNPEAMVTLTGCNANSGRERGNKKLSAARAEAVRDYLQTVWNVAPERIKTEARNLPATPSTGRLEEGRAENRRVEIRSDVPAILAPVRSTYLATRTDTEALTVRPTVNAPHGVARWTAVASNSTMNLGELSGDGNPPAEMSIPLKAKDLNQIAAAGDIKIMMKAQDRKGQDLSMAALPVKVDFIQTSQRMAQKQDFRIQEKYALILFDFDKDTLSPRNQDIVNAISTRIKELPQAKTEIVGHTDIIGKEDYNMKLSERRALTVYNLLSSAYGGDPGERISHRGVGQNNPLYDNLSPEARAFNRTVTITLEYMAKE